MKIKNIITCLCLLTIGGSLFAQVTSEHLWINEFRYDNRSQFNVDDQDDFVELIVSNQILQSSDVDKFKLVLYTAAAYDNAADNDALIGLGLPYSKQSIHYTDDETFHSLADSPSGFQRCPVDGMNYTVLRKSMVLQDIPSALALIYDDGPNSYVVQLLSYERAIKIKSHPDAGAAAGMSSTLIAESLLLLENAVTEDNTTNSNHSIQLRGTGAAYDDFSWNGDIDNTESTCDVNAGQTINDLPCINPVLNNPGTQEACEKYTLPAITGSFLTGNEAYYTMPDGGGTQLAVGSDVTTDMTIYIYDAESVCSGQVSFEVTINQLPDITNPGTQDACDVYPLPTIMGANLSENAAYYNDSQANGGTLISGNLTSSQMVWIYDSSAPGCDDEESFMVNIFTTPTINEIADVAACDSYTLPAIAGDDLTGNESYYTMPNGQGTPVSATTPITTTQTLYAFDDNNGCTAEQSFIVNITETPVLATVSDLSVCDSYELTAITGTNLSGNESYYTEPNAGGQPLAVGAMITSTQTIYIYDSQNGCVDEESFVVTVNLTPDITNPGDVASCDVTYTLPEINGDNITENARYYEMPNKGGTSYEAGNVVAGTTTLTLYIYDETVTSPNCFDEEMFTITFATPHDINAISAQESCGAFTFPPIQGSVTGKEKYHTQPLGSPGGAEFAPGATTATSGTYYVYDKTGTVCATDQESFTLTIKDTPVLDDVDDVARCDSYDLPQIQGAGLSGNENYYGMPNGQGAPLTSPITSSQTVYIYDDLNGCTDEKQFDVVITDTPQITNPGNQSVCDSYTLPTIMGTNLNNAKYYNNSQANNGVEISGIITETTTVWMYDSRGSCSDEKSFIVTITTSPSINNPGNQTACDSYTLPDITGDNLSGNQKYYTMPNGGGAEITTPITSTQTVYIYDSNNSCTDEESFEVTIINTPELNIPANQAACDSYALPEITGDNLNNPKYYDNSQANDGQVINGVITSSMQVWLYDAAGACSDEGSFMVTITESPSINNIEDATACDSYVLPGISGSNLSGNQTYYTMPNGGGTMVQAGSTIETTTTLYAYDEINGCSDEEVFTVNITASPDINDIDDLVACDSYTLPEITGDNLTGNEGYYTATNGGGSPLAEGATITESMLIYIFDSNNNCFDEENFFVEVAITPQVNDLADVTACREYTLPEITGTNLTGNEAYYNLQFGNGTKFDAGETITFSDTYYIFDKRSGCFSEETVEITIEDGPSLSSLQDASVCPDGSAAFFVAVNPSNGDYSYQWQSVENDTPQDINGEDEATLVLSNVTEDGVYQCVVTDNTINCSATTNMVTLSVLRSGDYNGTQTINQGETATPFAVTEAATSGSTYQWQSAPGTSTNFTNIDGATSATYAPGMLSETTSYQRVTSNTKNSTTCTEVGRTVVVTVQQDNSLGVQWLSIDAVAVGKTNVVKWATALEYNAANYLVEWSNDGKGFTKIGDVAANGRASQYEFIHTTPTNGLNYYRIQQVDRDSKAEYSKTISIVRKDLYINQLGLYPNPTTGLVNIAVPNTFNTQQTVQVQLYNITGKLMQQTVLNPDATINIGNLPAGVYQVVLQQNQNRTIGQMVKMD